MEKGDEAIKEEGRIKHRVGEEKGCIGRGGGKSVSGEKEEERRKR